MTAPDPSSPPPTSIARYRVERVLGGGARSTVYLARHPSLPQWAALKVLAVDAARDPAVRARFVQEGNTTAGLGHPNVVPIYGRGETDDGQLWIAMQYVQGTDAEAALQAGTMTPERAVHIVGEVAAVLDYAHSHGVIHQDVKPSNILLGDRPRPGGGERVLLSDFGAALTPQSSNPSDGPMMASVAYAAPEVIMGQFVDGRADVYSLGCTLFRLLTNQYPFPGDGGIAATITAHFEQPPPVLSDLLPWAGPQLDEVIATALAKDPAQRYPTATALADAAAAALRSSNAPSAHGRGAAQAHASDIRAVPIQPRLRLPASRRPLMMIVGIVAAIALVALLAWLVWPTPPPPPPPAAGSSATATAPPDETFTRRLQALLPPGYPTGSCAPPAETPPTAAAVLTCGPNRDPGGPTNATYTLTRTAAALATEFRQTVNAADVVVCPGNIQSPGAWRHVATPTVTAGTVFCGIAGGRPLVVWTNDSQLLLARTQSQTPDLNALYTWWSSHS